MKLPIKKRPSSILGVSLVSGHIGAAVATRAKAAVTATPVPAIAAGSDLAAAPTAAAGQELKAQLDAARVGERTCVVAVPARWVMSLPVSVPPGLTNADETSLLQIEAEKSLPCDPDEVQLTASPCVAGTTRQVTQLAVRKEQLAALSALLKAAGLKPASYTLGLDALPGAVPAAGQGRITLVLEATGVILLVAAGGGIAAFRTFDPLSEPPTRAAALGLARELRITLEQLPAELRREVNALHLFGVAAATREMAAALADWARAGGVALETHDDAVALDQQVAEAVARQHVTTGGLALEFLPPRPSRWAVYMARYNSPRLATAGFAVAGIVLLIALAFGWQQYRLWSLTQQWNAMAGTVKDLNNVTDRIREFRPWYDTSCRNLTILKRVVECFPDNGTVSAKSFEIHGQGSISITGTVTDNASLLRTFEQLRQTREVQGLKFEQIRGKTPAQFTFTFRWTSASGT